MSDDEKFDAYEMEVITKKNISLPSDDYDVHIDGREAPHLPL